MEGISLTFGNQVSSKHFLWDVAINPSVIGEDQLPLRTKCNLVPLWNVAISLSFRGEDQLPLETKCHQNTLWDVAINSKCYRGRFVTLGSQM